MKIAIAISLLGLSAGIVQAGIILDDSASSLQAVSSSQFSFSGFDATGSDKLVVTVAAEGNGGNRTVDWIQYNGVALTEAVNYVNTAGYQSVALFYLDNPTSAGDVVVDWSGMVNGVGIGVYALSGTAAGHEAANAVDGSSVSLTTLSDNAFVASVFVANGGTDPNADSPLTQLYGAPGSTDIGSADSAAGYVLDAGVAGAGSYSFSGFSGSRPTSGAVSFAAIPEPATLGLLGVCGGAMLFIRRRCRS